MTRKEASEDSPSGLPNEGYIHPMVCGSCLKLWVAKAEPREDEEMMELFGQKVPVRSCTRCIHESGLDYWPSR
jgi:hypothetical protein